MGRKENSKRDSKSTTREGDELKLIFNRAIYAKEEKSAKISRDPCPVSRTLQEETTVENAGDEAKGEVSRERTEPKDPVDTCASANAPDEHIQSTFSTQNCEAQFVDIQRNLDQLHLGQGSASAKRIRPGDPEPRKSTVQDLNECKFETSIDETSLKSFLTISTSTPEKDNVSINIPSCESERDADSRYTEAITYDIEHVNIRHHSDRFSSGGNSTPVKLGSDQTARTTDSYYTAWAGPVRSSDNISRSLGASEDSYEQEKQDETNVRVRLQESESDIVHSRKLGTTTRTRNCRYGQGAQPKVVKCTSHKELLRPKINQDAALNNKGRHNNRMSPLSPISKDWDSPHGNTSLMQGMDASQKNSKVFVSSNDTINVSKQTEIQSWTRRTYKTKVPMGRQEFAPSVHHKRQDYSDWIPKSLEHRGKAPRRSKRRSGVSEQKIDESCQHRPQSPAKIGLTRSGNVAKPKRNKKRTSLTLRSAKIYGGHLGSIERKGSHSGEMRYARKGKQDERAISEPGRSRDRDEGKHAKYKKDQNGRNLRTTARCVPKGRGKTIPIIFSTKDGVFFNENALVQIERGITNEIRKVVKDIQGEIRRKSLKEMGEKGLKLLMCGARK